MDELREAWRVPLLEVFRRIASTNDRARALAESGAPDRATVLADEQTAGRGRRGRRWHAPPGRAIMFSMVLRPGRSARGAPGAAPLRVGLVVAEAIERTTGLHARVKWPNDLLVDGGKVAGILLEGALGDVADDGFLIAGVGLNVGQREEDWPAEVRRSATSLELVAQRPIARGDLAGAIVRALGDTAPDIARPLDDHRLAALADRDALRGRRVTVDDAMRGTADGFEPDGSLRLRSDDGSTTVVRSGTVRADE